MSTLLQLTSGQQPSVASKPVNRMQQNAEQEVMEKQQTMLASASAYIDTNRYIDSYKTYYESHKQWDLGRKFMAMHKNKFTEDRHGCLSEVLENIVFLRCQYPAETMKLVAELSQRLAKVFLAKRASKLKRTFGKASDATEQRPKTMNLVVELSQEMDIVFRAESPIELKRIFGKASDAAEQKAKKRKLN